MKIKILDYSKAMTYNSMTKTTQIVEGSYKGVGVTETHIIPHFWGKKPTTNYLIDLVLPMGSHVCLSDCYYTADGYGMPVVNNLEEVIKFIDNHK